MKSARTIKKASRQSPDFVRFNLRQRLEHIVLMITFVVLAVTGLVQRFYTVGIAQSIILGLDGIQTTRLIHRGFALIFTLGIVYHFALITFQYFVKHQKLSMLPTLQDFRDIVTELEYGLGLKVERPRFGRYDYRQKFEYLGLIFGSVIITLSGMVLAFPILVTKLLTGQVVAAAVEIHGWEATLAVLTIVVWHLYEVIFKPGIFPADVSIFTGRISRDRMKEEHYLEYLERTKSPAVPEGDPPAA